MWRWWGWWLWRWLRAVGRLFLSLWRWVWVWLWRIPPCPVPPRWWWRRRHDGELLPGCCGPARDRWSGLTPLPRSARVLAGERGPQLAAVVAPSQLPGTQFSLGEDCASVALAEVKQDGASLSRREAAAADRASARHGWLREERGCAVAPDACNTRAANPRDAAANKGHQTNRQTGEHRQQGSTHKESASRPEAQHRNRGTQKGAPHQSTTSEHDCSTSRTKPQNRSTRAKQGRNRSGEATGRLAALQHGHPKKQKGAPEKSTTSSATATEAAGAHNRS